MQYVYWCYKRLYQNVYTLNLNILKFVLIRFLPNLHFFIIPNIYTIFSLLILSCQGSKFSLKWLIYLKNIFMVSFHTLFLLRLFNQWNKLQEIQFYPNTSSQSKLPDLECCIKLLLLYHILMEPFLAISNSVCNKSCNVRYLT